MLLLDLRCTPSSEDLLSTTVLFIILIIYYKLVFIFLVTYFILQLFAVLKAHPQKFPFSSHKCKPMLNILFLIQYPYIYSKNQRIHIELTIQRQPYQKISQLKVLHYLYECLCTTKATSHPHMGN